jgi:peptide/nickel transport system substrate-binding protein
VDPALSSGAAALEVVTNVLEPVVSIDAEQRVHPYLASSWTSDPDYKRWTFTLRDDVTFHDGAKLDSSAVKRTWDRILDPATKAAGVVSLLGPIDQIQTPDARTVAVTFKEPFPLFPIQIWRPYFGILSPKQLDAVKPGEKLTSLIGTGPYRWGGRSADGVIGLEAYPDHAWGPPTVKNTKVPYVQTLKFRAISEDATRVSTLESGENLLIDDVPEADYARLKADGRFRFVETPRKGLPIGFFINVDKAPTSELAVRQAINYSVDRKSIVSKVFFGVGTPTVGPLTTGVWGRLAELESQYGFDPQKAAQILEGAGWKAGPDGIRARDGQRLTLVLATFRSPWTEIAQVVQSQLRSVGMDVQVQKMERGPYLDFVRTLKHNLCASAGTDVDPDQLRTRYASTSQAANFSGLKDKPLDDLLNKGSLLPLGSEQRKQVYADIQNRLMELLPFVSVLSQIRIEGMASSVRGLQMGPDGLNAVPLLDLSIEA